MMSHRNATRFQDFDDKEPNEESLASIYEADEIIAAGGTGVSFDSGRELLDAIHEERIG